MAEGPGGTSDLRHHRGCEVHNIDIAHVEEVTPLMSEYLHSYGSFNKLNR
jgi:hypothetical protein